MKEVELKPPPNISFKLPFYPNKELKEELSRWFGSTRKTYNNGIAYLNDMIKKGTKKVFLEDFRAKCISNDDLGVGYDSKDIELQRALSAFRNPRRKKKFLEFRSKKHMYRESFTIPRKRLESKTGIYTKLFKKITNDKITEELLKELKYSIIISKTITGKYSFSIPFFIKHVLPADNQGQLNIVSIDPGTRTPFTCYDPSGTCFKVSEDKIDELYRYSKRRDRINSRIEYLKMFRGKRSEIESRTEMKVYCKITKRMRRTINKGYRVQERIDGLRNNFHYQAAKYILSRYNVVLIPEFNVKNMIEKGKSNLSKKQKRKLTLWSHHSFRQKLIYLAKLSGKKVIITDEHYTTKTCGNCGTLNDVGIKKEFECINCKVNLDRDYNASRNILIRFLSKLTPELLQG